jgi:hypothetical protein
MDLESNLQSKGVTKKIPDALIYKEESAFVLLPSHYYIPEFLELIICKQIVYYKINREK